MRGLPKQGQYAALKTAEHYPAADTAAVVTLAAIEKERHVIRKITVSYNGGVPAAAGLAVTIGGGIVFWVDLPLLDNQPPYDFDFPFGLYDKDNVNQEVVITAADPAEASTSVKLNVSYE